MEAAAIVVVEPVSVVEALTQTETMTASTTQPALTATATVDESTLPQIIIINQETALGGAGHGHVAQVPHLILSKQV